MSFQQVLEILNYACDDEVKQGGFTFGELREELDKDITTGTLKGAHENGWIRKHVDIPYTGAVWKITTEGEKKLNGYRKRMKR